MVFAGADHSTRVCEVFRIPCCALIFANEETCARMCVGAAFNDDEQLFWTCARGKVVASLWIHHCTGCLIPGICSIVDVNSAAHTYYSYEESDLCSCAIPLLCVFRRCGADTVPVRCVLKRVHARAITPEEVLVAARRQQDRKPYRRHNL